MTLFEESASGPAICRLLIAYDGTAFRGFAAQPDQRTVEGTLGHALAKVMRHEVALTCSGRTDAGVHAWGQVISFESVPGVDPERIQSALNGMLGPEIVVREAELVAPGFDARRSARWRHYRYTIVNRPFPDPFLSRYAWWVAEPLSLPTLRLAADPFVGQHDFTSFCKRPTTGSGSLVRRVLSSEWRDLGDGRLHYEVRATSFCWQMVRSLVGTMVEAGLGRRRPGDILATMRQLDRAGVPTPAPAHGLCLWEVGYETAADDPGRSR